ncbi:MAG: carbon starvation protein A, partial [Succinivibrionaceae bacterium]|nr:carbon starvation protein A [Succinivibrionaceae bacterium]
YGGMLVEGVLGVMSLLTVIYLSDVSFGEAVKHPQLAFADGMSEFITKIGLSRELSHPFISLVLAAFMMTSLDTATRLGRFVWQEILTGRGTSAEAQIRNPLIKSVFGFLSNSVIASMIIVGLAGYLACSGQGTSIWPVFGAANQLLAALTLLGISLYLIRIKSHSYIALIPMLFMMVMSSWGLIDIIRTREGVLVYASGLLLLLTVFLVILAIKRLVPGAEQKA